MQMNPLKYRVVQVKRFYRQQMVKAAFTNQLMETNVDPWK